MTTHYDAIIVGAGQAGPALASRLSQAGWKIAVVERKLFGGTCVNTGCIPTKTMIASAQAAHMARKAAFYGVQVDGAVSVDLKAVQSRKDEVSGKSRKGVEAGLRGLERCTVYQGHARFESPTQMRVGDELLSADKVFLNVGGRASIPELPGIDRISYLTNSTMMRLEELPRHLVVVGGSYVGIEFAQMFRRFGSEVTIVERAARLVQHEDDDVSQTVKEILEGEGIHLRLGSECIHFEPRGKDVAVGVACSVGEPESLGSHVLLAMGRQPNTDDLGLEKAGVERDKHGYIVVDDQLRSSVPGIWAMGDCNGKGGFTHTAYNDYEIVAANLLDNDPRRVSDRIHAHCLYTDPPLGQIGLTETQVRQTGRPALMGTRPMTKVGRAVEKGETQGFIKILVDKESQKIVGAAILGTGGDEAIHCILANMYSGSPYTALARAMHIHPTVSELIPTVLQSLKPLG